MKPLPPWLALALLITCLPCLAENSSASVVPVGAEKATHLWQSPSWLALGYYKKEGITRNGKWRSEVDDYRYFLAPNGKTNPQAELQASIDAFFVAPTRQSNICQFPARFSWLAEQLEQPGAASALAHCSEFIDWQKNIDATSVSMIFPAAYLDSPSSMFGHTLLRLDKNSQQDKTGLLSYTVSYAAQKKESDSELAFVYRGLVGGYPGEIAILPYYLKIKEYSDIESRDIWEYSLDLSQAEVDQLVRHVWEIKDLRFDYFFFSENCSYRVMSILNILRPDEKFLEQYPVYTIPLATIQDLFAKNLVVQTEYRPSVITRFNHMQDQLTQAQIEQVFQLTRKPDVAKNSLQALDASEHKAILDVAYAYSRLSSNEDGSAGQKSYQLLAARNLLAGPSSLAPVPFPEKRDDQGHTSERISMSFGRLAKSNFSELGFRPAYHDLTDPALGYPIGSELLFSDGSIRIYEDEEIELDRYTLLGIKSIKARNQFFKPTSWSVAIDATRDTLNNMYRLTPRLYGQVGYAYQPIKNALVYGMGGGELLVGSKLNKGIETVARLNSGLLWRLPKTQLNLDWQYRDSVISGVAAEQRLSATTVFSLPGNIAIKSFFERNFQPSRPINEFGLALQIFF